MMTHPKHTTSLTTFMYAVQNVSNLFVGFYFNFRFSAAVRCRCARRYVWKTAWYSMKWKKNKRKSTKIPNRLKWMVRADVDFCYSTKWHSVIFHWLTESFEDLLKRFSVWKRCVFEEWMLFFENVAYKDDTTQQVIPCANQSSQITLNSNQFQSKKSQPNGNRVKWHKTSDWILYSLLSLMMHQSV